MKRSVMISINPKWCEKIAAGQKQIEIRKNRPTYETPFKCYIYQTKKKWYCSALRLLGKEDLAEYLEDNHGQVIGEFICRDIEPITPYGCLSTHYATPRTCKTNLIIKSGLYPESELIDYLGYNKGFAWHISDCIIYDKSKKLSDFYRIAPCGAYNPIKGACDLSTPCIETPNDFCSGKKIICSPQSWCYVEKLK